MVEISRTDAITRTPATSWPNGAANAPNSAARRAHKSSQRAARLRDKTAEIEKDVTDDTEFTIEAILANRSRSRDGFWRTLPDGRDLSANSQVRLAFAADRDAASDHVLIEICWDRC